MIISTFIGAHLLSSPDAVLIIMNPVHILILISLGSMLMISYHLSLGLFPAGCLTNICVSHCYIYCLSHATYILEQQSLVFFFKVWIFIFTFGNVDYDEMPLTVVPLHILQRNTVM
jgi:hypothetical protein